MPEQQATNLCYRCGLPVPTENNAVLLEYLTVFTESTAVARLFSSCHLFPIKQGDEIICKGDPDFAQYLPGQPRDHSCLYDWKREATIRKAFQRIKEMAKQ